MANLSQVLDALGSQRLQHAKFLNTLSLLEYIGARKITKSLHESCFNFELLEHLREEIRHAQILKQLALQLSEGKLAGYSDDQLLAGTAGKAYFQSVDHLGEKTLGRRETWENYLLTTLVIEERAALVYPLYNEALQQFYPGQQKLMSIVRDEDRHLSSVQETLSKEPALKEIQLQNLRTFESLAFEKFMDEVVREVAARR